MFTRLQSFASRYALGWSKAFLAVALWDFLATAGVRAIAHADMLALPLAVSYTACWIVCTRVAVFSVNMAVPLCAGAALGTWLGIIV